MAILSEGHKPDNFEPHNSLTLSFTNIWGLCSNFVECESFLESNSNDILALCEINLDDSIVSGNFSVRSYLPLIQKGFITLCMVLQFMWRKDFICTRFILKKTLRILAYVFNWLYFTVSYSFSSILITFFVFMHSFWCYFI